MVSSTGTFVSCKDYDDDIDQINKELTDIKSAISELQTKVGAGKFVTNIVKEGEGIKITWNDNSTNTIETIKGADGAAGKNGTLVTIVDGYWAFDGVKSDYPAKGDKGDKGEDGAAAAAGHDAKISDGGYWMVWDSTLNDGKGDWKETEYVASGATAAQVADGWNIFIKDESGKVQTIYVPSSAELSSIDLLADAGAGMKVYYGIVNTEVKYGIDKAKSMPKGIYSRLDRDLKVLLNPAGVDATLYDFEFQNSEITKEVVVDFEKAVPYEGPALTANTRAVSANAVWVLPARVHEDLNEIDVTRVDLYQSFKATDESPYLLALTGTNGKTTIKSKYESTISLEKAAAITSLTVEDAVRRLIGEEYKPVFKANAKDSCLIYDYWLTVEGVQNQKDALTYGVEISDDGHLYVAKKEAAIDNSITLTYNYISIDGKVGNTTFDVTFGEKRDANMDKAFSNQKMEFNAVPTAVGSNVFTMAKTFDLSTGFLAEKTKEQLIKWNDALLRGKIEVKLDGGDPDNNADNLNNLLANNIRYTFNQFDAADKKKDGALKVDFLVSNTADRNFTLDNAYRLTFTVKDKDDKSVIGTIVLPFELSLPTLDITRENYNKAVWSSDKTAVKIYGDYYENNMRLPFYEAFNNAWSSPSVGNYMLAKTEKGISAATIMSLSYDKFVATALTAIVRTPMSKDWNTFIAAEDVAAAYNPVEDETPEEAAARRLKNVAPIKASYKMYGVYDMNVSDFTLTFASLLGEGSVGVKEGSKAVSKDDKRSIILTDADFTLTTGLGKAFYLFDGIKDNKTVIEREMLNRDRFEEGVLGFAKDYDLIKHVSAYYMLNGEKTALEVVASPAGDGDKEEGKALLVEDTKTRTRSYVAPAAAADKIQYSLIDAVALEYVDAIHSEYTYPAIAGGIMLQLPTTIGTTEPVTVVFTLVDIFGVEKELSFNLYAPGI